VAGSSFSRCPQTLSPHSYSLSSNLYMLCPALPCPPSLPPSLPPLYASHLFWGVLPRPLTHPFFLSPLLQFLVFLSLVFLLQPFSPSLDPLSFFYMFSLVYLFHPLLLVRCYSLSLSLLLHLLFLPALPLSYSRFLFLLAKIALLKGRFSPI